MSFRVLLSTRRRAWMLSVCSTMLSLHMRFRLGLFS
jgi:hypothetical protein